jgi:hypothetical protein
MNSKLDKGFKKYQAVGNDKLHPTHPTNRQKFKAKKRITTNYKS